MPDRFIRTFGATAVLVALGVAGFLQWKTATEQSPVEIVEQAAATADSITTPTVASTEPTPSTEAPELEPFVYKIGLLDGVTTENFWAYFGSSPTVWDAYILAPTKASLYRIDPESLEIGPEIARELNDPTWNSEGWKVDIELRGDMAWSDGTPLTAHDLAFTFETVRTLNLGGQWADVFPSQVLSISAIDAYHVEVKFDSRPSLEIWPYSVGTAPIMAEHIWGAQVEGVTEAAALYSLDGSGDVSGGPTDLVKVEEDRVISRANPGYRNNEAAEIVEYRVFPSEEAMLAGLAAGDVYSLVSPKGLTVDQSNQIASTEGVTTLTSPKFGVRYLGFNQAREPMNAVEFRRAVAFFIDRSALAEEIAGAPEATTLLPAAVTAWYDETAAAQIGSGKQELSEGLAQIVTELKAKGYTWSTEPAVVDGAVGAGVGLNINGRAPAALTVLTSGDLYDPARPLYAEKIGAAIELLGFKVITVPTDFATVVDLAYTPGEDGKYHYDMALLGWSLGNPGYPTFYADLFASDGAANNTGYASKTMDTLIQRLHKASDRDSAREIMWEIEALVATDVPYLPLYTAQITEAYRSDMVAFGGVELFGGLQSALGGIELVAQEG